MLSEVAEFFMDFPWKPLITYDKLILSLVNTECWFQL